jgi:hypothetical protein
MSGTSHEDVSKLYCFLWNGKTESAIGVRIFYPRESRNVRFSLVVSARLSVCMYVCVTTAPTGCIFLKSDVCRETANPVKIGKKIIGHMNTQVFFHIDSDVCRASLAALSEFITLFRMTYLRQQY